jgi:homoserine dehydrogenase
MKTVPVWIFGVGGVGGALLDMLRDPGIRAGIQRRAGLRFALIGLVDSRSYIIDAAGLTDSVIDAALSARRAGQSLAGGAGGAAIDGAEAAFAALQQVVALDGTIGVDATASDQMTPLWLDALQAGAGLALANKKPLSADQATFEALTRARRCRHEATVGAGLPIISTLYALLDSGDTVTSIQGCFSGTLGYICSAMNGGAPYSVAVQEAVAAGYAEPDPRDDLCGLDVARKALILSRMIGRSLNLDDLIVQPMIPDMLEGLSLDDFTRRLPEADAEMAERVRRAGEQGQALAYVADLSGETPTIGLQSTPKNSPIGSLSGTDNIAVFETARYNKTPLVIQGPGAGREVTAAGVLADMIALAREETLS